MSSLVISFALKCSEAQVHAITLEQKAKKKSDLESSEIIQYTV